jgi:hypothetical protein
MTRSYDASFLFFSTTQHADIFMVCSEDAKLNSFLIRFSIIFLFKHRDLWQRSPQKQTIKNKVRLFLTAIGANGEEAVVVLSRASGEL